MINQVLIIATLLTFVVILFVMYQKAKMKTVTVVEEDFTSIDKVVEAIKLEMVEIIKDDYSLGLSEQEFNALYKRKARINEALRQCVYGIDSAKVIVIELIRCFIAENVNPERVTELLGLNEGMEPSDHIKFEIMMYRYKKKYGKKALAEWLKKYDFTRERVASDALRPERDLCYYVTVDDLYMAYEQEDIHLNIEEQIDLLAVIVYQLYKGFGIVDTLREMDVNGFNMGTSGSILSNLTKDDGTLIKANNSVWLYFQGKYIHLRFMNFGNEDELKRIIQLLIRYGNPGPLTAKRGYLVNTMYDKSRILAMRPPVSEYWAIFVRKFTLDNVTPRFLVEKEYTKRADIPLDMMEYLVRGMMTCACTGRQGSGKTTMMSAIFRYIDPRYTIRVLEMAPELYLREMYPSRNILSAQETPTVSASNVQDAFKKSDGAVSIVGEVATDEVAARMIQMGQVASLFTIFSHHANTARDMVFALRNSLVNAGGFSNMDTAERQVIDVVKFDIHLDYTPDGKRYIERISEVVPLPENEPYPEIDPNDLDYSMAKIQAEYYRRTTDRISFFTHNIMEYDIATHTYKAKDRISPQLEKRIRSNLGKDLCRDFDIFMWKNWGPRKPYEGGLDMTDEVDEVFEAIKKYREEDPENWDKPRVSSLTKEGLEISDEDNNSSNDDNDVNSEDIGFTLSDSHGDNSDMSDDDLKDMELMLGFEFFDADNTEVGV